MYLVKVWMKKNSKIVEYSLDNAGAEAGTTEA